MHPTEDQSKRSARTLRRLQVILGVVHVLFAALFWFMLPESSAAKYIAIFILVVTVPEIMFLQKLINQDRGG